MELKSSAFSHEGKIPRKYTCQGLDISPPLEISNVPPEAKSLVLIMDDHDVPKHLRPDGIWDHWVVFNIDPKTTTLEEGAPPFGTLGKNTSGKNAYQGPCPPDREHRYNFHLFALDTTLTLPEGVTKDEVLAALAGHTLATATLHGFYEKT